MTGTRSRLGSSPAQLTCLKRVFVSLGLSLTVSACSEPLEVFSFCGGDVIDPTYQTAPVTKVVAWEISQERLVAFSSPEPESCGSQGRVNLTPVEPPTTPIGGMEMNTTGDSAQLEVLNRLISKLNDSELYLQPLLTTSSAKLTIDAQATFEQCFSGYGDNAAEATISMFLASKDNVDVHEVRELLLSEQEDGEVISPITWRDLTTLSFNEGRELIEPTMLPASPKLILIQRALTMGESVSSFTS